MDSHLLYTGILVFLSRICDVSIGTIRTITTVQGRTLVSFFLGLIEVSIWISVVSAVVLKVKEYPFLVIFYAFGYATGNVVGILVERKLAFGLIVLRVILSGTGAHLARRLREMGQPVTSFEGMGMNGPVTELYVVCRRRSLKRILDKVLAEDPKAFYITEQARDVRPVLKPASGRPTGWRAVFKRK